MRKVGVQKVSKKSIKSMVFRVRLFPPVQAALGRGFGRFYPELRKPVRRVLEDPPDPSGTLPIWRFAATFP